MKSGSSVLASRISPEVLKAIADEKTGERYLLMAPLSDIEAYRTCVRRRNLTEAVRSRLVALARGGSGDLGALLERSDLTGGELEKLAQGPGIAPEHAQKMVRHPACTTKVVAELAFVDTRREKTRAQGRMKPLERSGQVLGVLRNTNTLTRLASILIDNDLAGTPQEVEKALDALTKEKEASIEVFTTLAKDWYGTLEELIEASSELA